MKRAIELQEFLDANDRVNFVEAISFINLPIQYVGLIGSEDEVIFLSSKMIPVGEKMEIGEIIFRQHRKALGGKGEIKETFPGGRILAHEYLAEPGFDYISGVRIKLDTGDLVVTAGATPYSLYLKFGDIEREYPEYPLEDFRVIEAP